LSRCYDCQQRHTGGCIYYNPATYRNTPRCYIYYNKYLQAQ
jgi:hypothetical protein